MGNQDITMIFAIIGVVALGFGVFGAAWEIGRTVGIMISNRLPARWFNTEKSDE